MRQLSAEDKRYLLYLARRSLEASVGNQTVNAPEDVPSVLFSPGSAFVTLHHQSRLRGCVGYYPPVKPLYITVMEAASAAGLRDSRFPKVCAEELGGLELEISVLSNFRQVDPEEIQVGMHGLIVSQGSLRGLLLPQVAVARSWTSLRFLEETCRKAGLPLDAWRHGTKVELFTAEIFSEQTLAMEKASG